MRGIDIHTLALDKVGRILGPARARSLVDAYLEHHRKDSIGSCDDLRSFVKGDAGYARAMALRVLGSPDVYGSRESSPARSVNFVTCHDGMTLTDLVSYDHKRNEANGEGGRDGTDDDRSWGCGADGPSDDPAVEELRARLRGLSENSPALRAE